MGVLLGILSYGMETVRMTWHTLAYTNINMIDRNKQEIVLLFRIEINQMLHEEGTGEEVLVERLCPLPYVPF